MSQTKRQVSCLAKMRQAPWSKIVFGEDPHVVLVLLVAGGLLLYPFLRDIWPIVVGVLLLAVFMHAWIWCRGRAVEQYPPDSENG